MCFVRPKCAPFIGSLVFSNACEAERAQGPSGG